MLLVIEALLVFAALGQDHSASAAYPLDMAPNSVDDEYRDCITAMEVVKDEYLKNEITTNLDDFGTAWKEGEKTIKAPKDHLTIQHLIAIHAYTNNNLKVFSQFNVAARGGKDKYTKKTYGWYSLHFLLTQAIQILNPNKNCYDTFRGTKSEFEKPSEQIRLGSLSSSSLDMKVAKQYGTKSCFEIHTCYGADVTTLSKYPEEKEVLIPPYEVFKVTDVKKKTDHKDLWCETVYTLKSTKQTVSNLNCALVELKAKL